MKSIPFNEYLLIDGISATDMANFSRTPLTFAKLKGLVEGDRQEETDAMRMGTMVHAMVLEQDEFWIQYAIEPTFLPDGSPVRKRASDGSLRKTSEGKKYLEDFALENTDKQIISHNEWESVKRAHSAVMDNARAVELLTGALTERSLFWSREGVNCKGRIDAFNSGMLIDLKTTRDITPSGFEAESYRRKYHQKMAWYKSGLEANGIDVSQTCLITVCKDECIVRDMDSALMERGTESNNKAFEQLKKCLETKVFPSWPDSIQLGLPPWAMIDFNFEGET